MMPRIKDLEKRLQKIQKENEKLKKNKGRGESSWCIIF